MTASPEIRLHEQRLSLDHDALARVLIGTENVLIVQDLDGVCMGLVKDPLQRIISLDYVRASRHLDGHFYVLTNGEHIGTRGVNGIIERAIGDTIIFIDSDLVVTETFLQSHADGLTAGKRYGDRTFTYGRVVNTCNFENPTAEPYKITDFSAAYFATGNVAIARHWLLEAGLFDPQFQLYGWEDLELGVRLKKLGLKLIKCPDAVGYHWHPPFDLSQIPQLIEKEIQRGRMGVVFYQKHPTFDVRMMIQMTILHRILWGILSLGGQLNERSMAKLLQWLIDRGKPQLALEIARIFLNWYNVRAVYAAWGEARQKI